MFPIIVIFVLVELLLVSEAELSQNIRPPSNDPSSFVSFIREDVPVSYTYSSLHKTTKPSEAKNVNHHQPALNVNYPVQYAPLKISDPRLQNGMYAKKSLHSPHNTHSEVVHERNINPARERKPIEPRVEPKHATMFPNPLAHLDYTPGHNVEVLRSVNRSPGHNAVYNTLESQRVPDDKHKKVNFLNQYIIYKPIKAAEVSPNFFWSSSTASSPITTPSTTSTTSSPSKPPVPPYVTAPNVNMVKSKTFNQAPSHLKQQLKKTPYTKMHALLLNVARAYNLALTPHKSLHPGASISVLGKIAEAPQTLMNIPGSSKLLVPSPEIKTLLYPVQKNLHFAIHS